MTHAQMSWTWSGGHGLFRRLYVARKHLGWMMSWNTLSVPTSLYKADLWHIRYRGFESGAPGGSFTGKASKNPG